MARHRRITAARGGVGRGTRARTLGEGAGAAGSPRAPAEDEVADDASQPEGRAEEHGREGHGRWHVDVRHHADALQRVRRLHAPPPRLAAERLAEGGAKARLAGG